MKVVLFCGGLGLRIRDYSDKIPKPLIEIGGRPILWHVMKYYAHFGHTDFILCLGYKGETIKRFFLDYDPRLTEDFTLAWGPRGPRRIPSDISDWNITFVDTGLHSTIGERLLAVRPLLEDESHFLATYSDTLTDAPLDAWIERFRTSGKTASFMCVRPHLSLHHVEVDEDSGVVRGVHGIRESMRINGGYFALRNDIFDYLRPGEELVEEPFARLIERGLLIGQIYDGFWGTMDTYKDHQNLEGLLEQGAAPWQLWHQPAVPVALRRA